MREFKGNGFLQASTGPGLGLPKSFRMERVNLSLVGLVLALVFFGLLVVYSAVRGNESYNFPRQVLFVIVGIVIMLALFQLDYRKLEGRVKLLLGISLALTLLPHLPLLGSSVNGASSWVSIGGVGFQPGELAKVTVILMAASCVAKYKGRLDDPREYLKCLGLMLIPFLGVMTQPDLGTGLVYLVIDAVALLIGGARPKFLLATVGAVAAMVAALLLIDPVFDRIAGQDALLKDYQKARLLVFMNNDYDPTGDGYNLQQAKIAVGSGGFFGKGYLNSTQSSLGYLPEAPTDFIFCVLAEEFGFVGSVLLLVLYAALIIKAYGIAKDANNLFGSIVVMCIAGMWLFQVMENIGMDLGIMPITGIPLPFISYGSSFMIVNFVLLGLIGSVWAQSKR